MRILFTCIPAISHFYPLVPVARALAEAGHDVTFATHAILAPAIEHAGFRHVAAGFAFSSPQVADLLAEAGKLRGDTLQRYTWTEGFAGLLARRVADDLLALPDARDADLIVRDSTELGGCIAAERLGLPHAAISVLSTGMTPGAREWIAEPWAVLRAAHGLPPDPDVAAPFRYLTLHQAPRSFLALDPLSTDQQIRPVPFDRSDDKRLPAWMTNLPDRPTVYATLGTVFNKRTDIFEAILAGLRDEPVNVIVTVGRDRDPALFGPQPPHIRIERYVSQTMLFPRCDLVLSHGGSGTVMSALTHGLPLVIVPIGADQPQNAERCAALGVGRTVEMQDVTPDAIRDAVRTVLSNPSFRRAAGRLRGEIATLPGPSYAAGLLTRLASERQPMIAAAV